MPRSAVDLKSAVLDPREEFVDPIDRVIVGNAREDVGEIGLGVDAVQLAGLDQRREDCPVLATGA